MSTTIDEKIVSMQFDNKQFESNVQTSLNSIDKLKQGLKFDGAAKGLENVDAAAKGVNMSPLGSAVEAVSVKFSAMQIMAVTALANITNSAVNAGKRIVSALTIDPIKTGLSEYETQINAVQTILANTESKGTTITDVNKALDELNTYADKTIYNFTEMTRNIGTFTAAGVELDTSVSAIKGIANLAAVSGSNSQQASTAMYQLSQALSSGTVKLMDWNSVVNAGMGGQVFQDALKETARVHGIEIDEMIESNGSFRETLQEGWLTSEVLLETLDKFTMTTEGLTDAQIKENREMWKAKGYTDEQIDAIFKLGNTATNAATKVKTFTQLWDTLKETAQSGWTQTWELIFGDFEEAKSFFSEMYETLSPIIEASSAARNELLTGWKEAGGRNDLIQSLRNVFEGIGSIVAPIKEAFKDVFPELKVEHLVKFTQTLKELTAKMKLSDETSANLKNTFKGVFAIFEFGRQIISAVVRAIGPLFGVVGDLGGGILGLTGAFGEWLAKLAESARSSDIFYKALKGVVSLVVNIADVIKALLKLLKEKIVLPGWDALHTVFERVHTRMSQVGDAASSMQSGVVGAFKDMGAALINCDFFKAMQSIWNVVKTLASGLMKVLGGLTGGLLDKLGNADFSGLLDFVNTISLGGIAIFFTKFVKGFSDVVDSVDNFAEEFKKSTIGILNEVKGCFEAYQTQLKANVLLKIAGAIAILAAAILVLSLIDSEKLSASLGAITVLFADLMGAMAVFNKIAGTTTDVSKSCASMIAMSVAVLILAGALKKIGSLEPGEMATGLVGVLGLTAIVVAASKILGSGKKTVLKGAMQMVIFAAAIKILASVCDDLSYLSWEELAKGLVGVAALMAAVSVFMRTAKFSGKAITTATGMVILASAIKILASACEDFAYMSWGDIGKGLVGISALLIELALFTKLTGNAKHVISAGIALIAIGAAMKIFASAVQDLASMTWEELGRGLLGMAGSLAAVVAAMRLVPKNTFGIGVGLIAVSTALVILASAFTKMGSMDWSGVAKGLISLGGSLAILAIGLHAMKGTAAGATALLIAAGALAIFAPTLSLLGAMSWGSIAKGLIAVAGAFAILGVAALVLGPLTKTILMLSGAVALLGVGVLAMGVGIVTIGAGLSAIAVGISALAGSLATGATVIVSALVAIISGVVSLIPVIFQKLGEGIVELFKVISNGMPAIADAIKSIVLSVIDVYVECIPALADGVLKLVTGVLAALVEYTPTIIDHIFSFLISLLDGIAARLPELIQSAVNVLMAFFTGIVNALQGIDTNVLMDGIAGVGMLSILMVALAAVAALIPAAMIGVLGMGLVIAELAIVLSAVGMLTQIPGLDWLISEGGQLLGTIGTAIGSFVGGIVGGFASGVTDSLPKIADDLSEFMDSIQPFIEGARNFDSSTLDGVRALCDIVLMLTAANIVDGLTSWFTGGSTITTFAEEIVKLGNGLRKFSDQVANMNPENVVKAAQAAKVLADMTSVIPNSGGVVGWFAGENSIAQFGNELTDLGKGLKGFSDAVADVQPQQMIAASEAAKVLADMTSIIPNSGGVVGWFAGENSIAQFGNELINLGLGLKGFDLAVAGITPANIAAAAGAAKVLAEMTNVIPNSGGVASWFAGDNSIAKFSQDIIALGVGLAGFSLAVGNIAPDKVVAAATAAKSIAEMTAIIPNSGGVVAWFTGDNSLSKFSEDIVLLGNGLAGFSTAVTGIVVENVIAGAAAAKALAELTTILPDQGGIVAWFTGDESISKFGGQLPLLGLGLRAFDLAVAGITPDNIVAAAGAAKALAELTNIIPNQGGIVAWFTGETSISKFSKQLTDLGKGLKGFSTEIGDDLKPENITAAAQAAKALAEMTAVIPAEGGIKAWFTGETSIANFADKLPKLGKGLRGFSDEIGDKLNAENMTAASQAAKSLAEMTAIIPTEGGIKAWFTGETSVANFADKLPKLGEGLKGFADSLGSEFAPENVQAAATAAKSLAEMTETVPKNTDKIVKFGDNLKSFGTKLAEYFSNTSGITSDSISITTKAIDAIEQVATIDSGNIKSVSKSIDEVVKSLKGLSKIPKDCTSEFSKAMKALGDSGVDKLLKTFSEAHSKVKDAGTDLIGKFADGIKNATSKAEKACKAVITACVDAIGDKKSSFTSAGKSLVEGFANGISANTFKAEAQAKAMANAAAKAAKNALNINSPSRVFRDIGYSVPEGFALGIERMSRLVEGSSEGMASTAVSAVSNSISRLAAIVNSDIDTQPTIRPVVDLSDVKSKAGTIGSIFDQNTSVGVLANVGHISATMSRNTQHDANIEVVSAINKLRRDMANLGNTTYNVNGVTYDDGSNVAEAVQTIARAIKIEGRV